MPAGPMITPAEPTLEDMAREQWNGISSTATRLHMTDFRSPATDPIWPAGRGETACADRLCAVDVRGHVARFTVSDLWLEPEDTVTVHLSRYGVLNGSFRAGDGSLSGSFYGPNHDEVGGTFERGGLIGAFGAERY